MSIRRVTDVVEVGMFGLPVDVVAAEKG